MPHRLKQTPIQVPSAPATYPLGVESSLGGSDAPEDYELKDRGSHRSVRGTREAAGWAGQGHAPTIPRTLGQAQHRDEGKEAYGALTLTDSAIDSHCQPQALVFLAVDGFGCKIKPQDVKEGTFVRRKQKCTCLGPCSCQSLASC